MPVRRYAAFLGRLIWKFEDEEDDGEGIGPWWVDDGDESPEWVRRSKAEQIARDEGHEFAPDE